MKLIFHLSPTGAAELWLMAEIQFDLTFLVFFKTGFENIAASRAEH